ncbi:hypothetical protein E2C01_021190 [Portunus trituberculatus]|uniref:Uncharacterized protein n=1 Tax=Portunus trituberculatus TaxID=210409 RepID=A0A5B7E2L0_PORTR|nr:hypothetical protein [Portunus trituberculatus]
MVSEKSPQFHSPGFQGWGKDWLGLVLLDGIEGGLNHSGNALMVVRVYINYSHDDRKQNEEDNASRYH